MGSRSTFYRNTGVVLARASTAPGALDLPTAPANSTASSRDWLASLWQDEEIQSALKVASPVLSHRIESAIAGDRVEDRDLTRLLEAVLSYLRRWQRRATPFGLFAGVAVAPTSTPPAAAGRQHHLTAGADARWLDPIVDELEKRPDVLFRLSVMTNNAGVVRDGRFVVPTQPDETRPHGASALDLSMRLTRPVRAALAAAEHPVALAMVCDGLIEQFPRTPREKVQDLLVAMVRSGALITNLRAPMTGVDPLQHLIDVLHVVGVDAIPDVADLVKQLSAVHEELPRDAVACAPTRAALEHAAEQMRTVRTNDKVLAVDVALDEPPTVPTNVLTEAESAASALMRLTPHPFGAPAWRDYHHRFLTRYGAGVPIPVREVIADSGLGFPNGWLGAARPHSPHMLTERDSTLLHVIQQATAAGHREIAVTEQLLEQFRVGEHEHMLPPERIELAFQLHSSSPWDLQQGRFQLWVTGAMHPGSMAGRFAHLLSRADQQRLAETYISDQEHTVTAQLCFPPRRVHNTNITRVPRLLPHIIPLNEYHGAHDNVITLDDLAVIADHRSMGLVRLSTGQRVRPWVLHALEAQTQTPPLARFLAELSTACSGFFGLVDFGAAREMPMLPRLRYGRTVLSPAQWRLPQAELPTAAAEMPAWENALTTWRDRWHIPRHVLLVEGGEQRLPLDLDDQRDRASLRSRLNQASNNHVLLRETGGPDEHAWSGQVCEFVTPFIAPQTKHQSPAGPHYAAPQTAAQRSHTSTVLRADLLGHPWRFNDVLVHHLPQLLTTVAEHTRQWWFSRQHDPHRPDSDQHLTLFFRLADDRAFGDVATRVTDWVAYLRTHGVLSEHLLSTQHTPTTYGGPAALGRAEDIFNADSVAALAQLGWANGSGLPAQATAAVSLAEFAASLANSPEAGYHWLIDLLPQNQGKLDRSLRDSALQLASGDPLSEVSTLPDGQELSTAWQRRREAVTTYRDQHTAEVDPEIVLRALLHEHHRRAVGVDSGSERLVHRLARAVAQRRLALCMRKTP